MLEVLLQYPNIDPTLIEIGPIAIRWYSLSYIGGLLLGWWGLSKMNSVTKVMSAEQYDAILTWAILGVVFGGRLGYVIFYKPLYFLNNPAEILAVWEGGMSFHGGMLGVIVAIYWFTKKYKIEFFKVIDLVAVVAPVGLLLGRIANFINAELYGRATTHWVGMVFPSDPQQIPRHPSQLYEAALEGLVLGLIMFIAFKIGKWQKPKFLSGLFLIGYGTFRSIAELFREPDAHLGFIIEGLTMGQLLSFPMVMLGVYLVFTSGSKTKNS